MPEQTFLRESALQKRLEALAGISQGKSWAREGGARPHAGRAPGTEAEHPSMYGPQGCFGKDVTDPKQTHCCAEKQCRGQRETPPAPSGFIIAPGAMSDRRVIWKDLTQIHFSLLLFNLPDYTFLPAVLLKAS